MAAIAYTARTGGEALRVFDRQTAPSINFGDSTTLTTLRVGTEKDNSDGSPAPCLKVRGWSSIRFRLAVDAGARKIGVGAKQPLEGEPRPYLIVHPNPDVGLASALTQTAPTGAGWVAIGPATFTATAAGGVWVELVNPASGRDAWFDSLYVK